MNTFIDTISVLLQQLLFHLSLNASETAFSTAQLYESMNKLSSILNYKPFGKQTSILPVNIQVNVPTETAQQFTIPKFMQISHNSNFVLKQDMIVSVVDKKSVVLDAAMF